MKRIFTRTLPALLLLLSFSSCVREYTCQCVITYTGKPGLPDTVQRNYPIRDTKDKARDICKGNSQAAKEQNGVTTKETCDLY